MRTIVTFVALLLFVGIMPVAAQPASTGALDSTFVVGADIHIGDEVRGMTDQIAINHVMALNQMRVGGDRLRWPDKTIGAGARIPVPEAVFIAGDLMRDNSINLFPATVMLLKVLYMKNLQSHAYFSAGNHDTWSHMDAYTLLGNRNNNEVNKIIGETAKYRLISSFHPSWPMAMYSSPAHYAVALGNGKLLAVVLSPSIAEPCRAVEGGLSHGITRGPTHENCDAVAWLDETIKKHIANNGGNGKAPVIIIQHYGYDAMGVSGDLAGWSGYWWDPGAREALAGIIRKYNVIAVIDGHTHVPSYTDPKNTRYDNQPVFGGEVWATLDTGYPKTRGWADVNKDGNLDFCRVVASGGDRIATCRLFDGAKFGAEVSSEKLDPGYDESVAWVDVNDDGKADFCRVVGHWDRRLRCELSDGQRFKGFIESGPIDAGEDKKPGVRFWVDANHDGKTDFCRIGNDKHLGCFLSTGTGFTFMQGGKLDFGWLAGRTFADVDGDGKLDFCRLTGEGTRLVARCALFKDSFQDGGFTSAPLDGGAGAGRMFIDVNRDNKADFCRLTDYRSGVSPLGATRCTPSDGRSFTGPDIVSSVKFYDDVPGKPVAHGIDLGYDGGRAWADMNGDRIPEYCRTIVQDEDQGAREACSTTVGLTLLSPPLDPGYADSRTWVDINHDGRADFCRVTGRKGDVIRCTLASTAVTVPPVDSFSVASGYCWGDNHNNVGGFTVFRVTDDRFEAVEVTKPPLPFCGSPDYDGSVTAGAVFTKAIVTQ